MTTKKKKVTQKQEINKEVTIANTVEVADDTFEEIKTDETLNASIGNTSKEDDFMPSEEELLENENKMFEVIVLEEPAKIARQIECPHCHEIQDIRKTQDSTTSYCIKCQRAFLTEWKIIDLRRNDRWTK